MAGGFSTSFEITGLDRARLIAQRVTNLGEDPRPLLSIAGSLMERSTINRFDGEHGPGGVPWPKSKRAAGLVKGKPAGKTLTDTSDLRDSIRVDIDEREVAIGSDGLKNPVKALANQFGSHRQAVVQGHIRIITQAFGVPLPTPKEVRVRPHGMITNLPARPFIGFDDDDRRELETEWLGYLKGLLQ